MYQRVYVHIMSMRLDIVTDRNFVIFINSINYIIVVDSTTLHLMKS